jgi:hypothetical protein
MSPGKRIRRDGSASTGRSAVDLDFDVVDTILGAAPSVIKHVAVVQEGLARIPVV